MSQIYIKEWRRYRGMTVEALAQRIGVSHASLSRIESGRQPYKQGYLESIGAALDCTPWDLLMRDPSGPESIFDIYRSLGEAQKRQLVEIAKTLKGDG